VRALISVYDKSGLVPFARDLLDMGWELVSTGGSARHLIDAGLPVTSVDEVTGFPEILDGRVKTLHPNIHGGLLARADKPAHLETLAAHGITRIDLLASNLYPFERSVSDPSLDEQGKIEQIDIGGPAMVRAAAKNYGSVIVVTDPGDYPEITRLLRSGGVGTDLRRRLAARAFGHVSAYDSLVSAFLRNEDPLFPAVLTIPLRHAITPKYGENPQQPAAAYRRLSTGGDQPGILDAKPIAGEPLSFNNFLDADAAWQAAQLFSDPAVAIVKHMVPCGLSTRETLSAAYEAAFAGDPVSAFGGIVALNRVVDLPTATLMRKIKLDIIIAPGYDDEAREILLKKKGTRILSLPNRSGTAAQPSELDVRPIAGGLLVQLPDSVPDDPGTWKVVTQHAPTDDQMADLAFAWKAARLVKSNAIVFARNRAIVGLGAGQPNRLESVNLAARKAGEHAKGAALASDAFFPFADGVELAAAAGIGAIIQPGGSMRDAEVIAAANAAGIPMVLTGTRHFRH
jgi:phosphoribosylaminoimidazolecarboxamide formyltransferase/IMP cyclohydrolase